MTAQRRRVLYLLGAGAVVLSLLVVAAWACGDEPWIDIGSPDEGESVGGEAPITATPVGGGGASAFSLPGLFGLREVAKPEPDKIARVKFFARGKLIATVTGEPPYATTWDTTKFHDGHCALVAWCYGAGGEKLGRSRTVHVTIANLVTIDSLAKREEVGGAATISGSVTEGVNVTEIRLYVRGKRIATLTESPFSFEWDTTTVDDGEYIVRVRVYDGKKQLGHSAVRVVVNNN